MTERAYLGVQTREGHASWDDLIGKTFEFLFHYGWEEPEWLEITLHSIYQTENEFHAPVYYLTDEGGGGYMHYESDAVQVRVPPAALRAAAEEGSAS